MNRRPTSWVAGAIERIGACGVGGGDECAGAVAEGFVALVDGEVGRSSATLTTTDAHVPTNLRKAS